MPRTATVVIVGAGLAGAKTAEALRDKAFDGRIVLVGDETQLPYDRVPLSKDFLAEKTSPVAQAYDEAGRRLTLSGFTVHDDGWYRAHEVELRLGTPVSAMDSAAHRVTLADGTAVAYDQLVLATGSRPRQPQIAGADADRVHYLRSYEDAVALDAVLSSGSSLTVVGAGWIGLEVAASARQRGVNVTVVGRSKVPLQRALGERVGEIFAGLHRDNGVDLRMSAQVARIVGRDGVATGVELTDGSVVDSDAALLAVGAEPNIELAEQAGLALTAGGVAVDASLRSSAPDVYAVGDIAAVEHPLLGTRIRTGHWADALKQPVVAAANILGENAEYADLPYFFTDQYDLGMEYVGHAPDYSRVVFRSGTGTGEFVAFWLDDDDRVLAGMTVNVWGMLDDIKRLIRARTPVDVERLGDPGYPLGSLVPG